MILGLLALLGAQPAVAGAQIQPGIHVTCFIGADKPFGLGVQLPIRGTPRRNFSAAPTAGLLLTADTILNQGGARFVAAARYGVGESWNGDWGGHQIIHAEEIEVGYAMHTQGPNGIHLGTSLSLYVAEVRLHGTYVPRVGAIQDPTAVLAAGIPVVSMGYSMW